jgi:glycosyltransferase involved in cell wall biosynthesis
MKVAYITQDSPHDLKGWSGLAYYIGESVRRHGAELDYFGPLDNSQTLGMRVKRRLYHSRGKDMLEVREPALVKKWAREIEGNLRASDAEIILSTHTYFLSEVKTDLPIVIFCDSNFQSMLDSYPYYQNLTEAIKRQSHEWERRDLARADAVCYACDWARDYAINTYGADPAKVHVVPFGANIECDRTEADIEDYIARRPRDKCRLLFLGKIWERKGGDKAVAVAEALNKAGLPTTLTLMGSHPPADKKLPDFVNKLGFINKNEPAGLKQFNAAIGESHFLILPSKAEAFGIVFGEAASFGVPSLANAVGGITTAVKDGATGQTFPPDADPKEFADYVLDKFEDYDRYIDCGRRAFQDFKTRTNWGVSGKRVYDLMTDILARRNAK